MVTDPVREKTSGTFAINKGLESRVKTLSQQNYGAMITLGYIMTYFYTLYVICLTFKIHL